MNPDYRPKLTEAGAAFVAVAKKTLESARYAARVGAELGKNKIEAKLHLPVDPLVSPNMYLCLSELNIISV